MSDENGYESNEYAFNDLELSEEPLLDEETGLREKPEIATTIEALRSTEKIEARVFYGLSDLSVEELEQFAPAWESLDDDQRRKLMRQLVEVSEANVEMDYIQVGRYGLDDPDAEVREAAIEVLWEDESLELMNRLIDIAQYDDSREVRAAACSALGRFLLMGELGDISESDTTKAQEAVIHILNDLDEEVEVRRRALEALGNSSSDAVTPAIEEAYESPERLMNISAVFAMGRSCDPRWSDTVMHELDSGDPEMRYEAARAVGELMLEDAVAALSRMAFENDRELQDNAIWSLGEIGGREATRVLNLLAENAQDAGDEDMVEAIEDAIANANLSGSDLYLMRMDDDK